MEFRYSKYIRKLCPKTEFVESRCIFGSPIFLVAQGEEVLV